MTAYDDDSDAPTSSAQLVRAESLQDGPHDNHWRIVRYYHGSRDYYTIERQTTDALGNPSYLRVFNLRDFSPTQQAAFYYLCHTLHALQDGDIEPPKR